jgi:cell division protein FtsW
MLIRRSDRGLFAIWWYTIDRVLLTAVLLLMAAGVIITLAASPPVAERLGLDSFHFAARQLVFLLPAATILIATSFLDERQARWVSLWCLIAGFGLMVAAIVAGPEIKGAHRWIGIGPVSFQPSELVKPALVVIAAWLLAERTRRPDMPGPLLAFALFGIAVVLMIMQPDIGQTAVVVAVFAIMLVVYGIPWAMVGGLAALASAAAAIAYLALPHVSSRIDRFFRPAQGDTFQIDTALQAFRNGGLFGAGPGGGVAKRILPDAHSDFIFSVLGEEFGLVAGAALLGLFAFIVVRVLLRALQESDPFAALALTGLVAVFGLQAMINMAVNLSLLPAKGLTLPFVSYGGSSLISMALTMGLILVFARRRPRASLPLPQAIVGADRDRI